MRDNFSMLPIVQDNMNCIAGGVRSLANLSSNGYYGYQPPLHQKEEVHVQPCLMEVELPPGRKRCWEQSEEPREFKKRRQNESSPFAYEQSSATPNRDVKLRKPTHNIPDMPRCIMGHYI